MAGVPPCILYFLGCRNPAEYRNNNESLIPNAKKKKWGVFRPVFYTFWGVTNLPEYRKKMENTIVISTSATKQNQTNTQLTAKVGR